PLADLSAPVLTISRPQAQVGEEVTLVCDSPDAKAPELSLQIKDGNRTLASGTKRPLRFKLVAHKEDDGREFVCEAKLDIKGFVATKQASANLTVISFQDNPHLHVESFVETDTITSIMCQVAGVFPSEKARFNLSFEGGCLNATVSAHGDRATAEAQVSCTTAGERELNCTVALGPVTRSTVTTVCFYNLSAPVLRISRPQAQVGEEVTLVCDSPDAKA
uniref:Intercellular adhesion molecule 1/3/5 D2 domain-containing protein n=1 Tax=Sphenodon punctatus TaxID=8508 RepID=A0A8D0G866_SPHPU